MRSSGSITLPFTLLIFSPVSSTTRPCNKTRENGGSPMEVDAHHHHPGHPEEEDVVAVSRSLAG
jgi:hypothetical protein